MHLIILFFFIYSNNVDGNEDKYIDLLPEKEKQEFIDQIARRILEEVKTVNETITKSGEISDDRLDKHDDFVRKILDEELRKVSIHDSKPINIIPLNKTQHNKDDRIDLTLNVDKKNTTRSGRKVFEGFVTDESSEDENNKGLVNEETDLDIQVKNIDKDEVINKKDPLNDDLKIFSIETIEDASNYKINENEKSYETVSTNTPNVDEITTTEVHNIITSTIQIINIENGTELVKEKIKTVSKYVADHENIPSLSDSSNIYEQVTKTPKAASSEHRSRNSRSSDLKNDSNKIDHFESVNIGNATTENEQDYTVLEIAKINTTTTENLGTESTTEANYKIESDLPTTIISTSEKRSTPLLFTTENSKNTVFTTTETLDPEISHANINFPSKITTTNVDSIERASPTPMYHVADNSKRNYSNTFLHNNIVQSNGSKVLNTYTQTSGENSVEKLLNNMLNILRVHILRKTNQTVENKHLKSIQESVTTEYRVYEIPANGPPFTKESRFGTDHSDRERYDDENFMLRKRDEKPIAWDYLFGNDYTRNIKSTNKSKDIKLKQHPEINLVAVDNYSIINIDTDDNPDLDHVYNKNKRYSRIDVKGNRKQYSDESGTSGLVEEMQSGKEIKNAKMEFKNNLSYFKHLRRKKPISGENEEDLDTPKDILFDMRDKDEKIYYMNNFRDNQPKPKELPQYIYILSRQKRTESSRKKPKEVAAMDKILTRLKKVKNIEIPNVDEHKMKEIIAKKDTIYPKEFQFEEFQLQNRQNVTESISEEINVYINIVEDKIKDNDKALMRFDWLVSTIDLQAALMKMNHMLSTIQYQELHPPDLELLKYLIYIHKTAKRELDGILGMSGRKSVLPKGNRKKKDKDITSKGLIYNLVWLVRTETSEIAEEDLTEFQLFLDDMESALYDLHIDIKYISFILTYEDHNWFQNLKELRQFNRKECIELLVHLFGTRILGLIEKSARNGMVNDHTNYIKNNQEDVKMTEKEFLFLLKLLHRLKNVMY